jgi:hypothetical protein
MAPVQMTCRKCGNIVRDELWIPSASRLDVLRRELNEEVEKKGVPSAAEQKIFALIDAMIVELGANGYLIFCSSCREELATLLNNPSRLYVFLGVPHSSWLKRAKLMARVTEAEKIRVEKRVRRLQAQLREGWVFPSEKARARADDEWLSQLVRGRIFTVDVGDIDPSRLTVDSVLAYRVPGCKVYAAIKEVDPEWNPVIYGNRFQLILCRSGRPIRKGRRRFLVSKKKHVVPLCRRHSKRVEEISIELKGEQPTRVPLGNILEQFRAEAVLGNLIIGNNTENSNEEADASDEPEAK